MNIFASRFKQVRWIIFTYVSRPAVLVLLGIGLLLLLRNGTEREYYVPTYPTFPLGGLRVDSKASLDKVRREGLQDQVVAIDLTGLWASLGPRLGPPETFPFEINSERAKSTEEFFKVISEFPNLRSIHWSLHPGFPGLKQVANASQLEQLTLRNTKSLDLAPLSALSRLPHLRRIDFGFSSTPIRGLAALKDLPALHTVEFSSRVSIDDKTLGELSQLPHIQTVILAFYDRLPTPYPFTEAGFEALSNAPSLQTVYLGGYLSEDRAALFERAKASLTGVTIMPSFVRNRLDFLLPPLPFLCLGAIVGIQLSTQFLTAASRTQPHFVTMHGAVGLAILLMALAGAASSWLNRGAATSSALLVPGTYVFVITALCCQVNAAQTMNNHKPMLTLGISIALGGFLMTSMMVSLVNPGYVQKLALHPDPLASLLFAVISLAAIIFAVGYLTHLSTSGPAEDARPVSFRSMWLDRKLKIPEGRLGRIWRRQEHAIEQLPRWSSHRGDAWRRLWHWRVGNLPQPSIFPIVMTAFSWIMMTAMNYFLFGNILGNRSNPMQPSLFACNMGFLMGALQIGIASRRRVQGFATELMKPIRRDEVLSLTFRVAALDLIVPVLIFTLGTVLSLAPAGRPFSITALVVGVPVGLWLGSLFAALLLLIALTIQRLWLGVVLGYVVFFAAFMSLMTFGSFVREGLNVGSVAALTGIALPANILGLTLCYCLCRRWNRMEFGMWK